MTGQEWLATSLLALAAWVLLSGLDDLFLQLAFCYLRLRGNCRLPRQAGKEPERARPKRLAIFVPLWREDRVIEHMLEHNLAANSYPLCDFFVGAYPNDPLTVRAVSDCEKRFGNVHLALCPHDGPTSKADCLNWIYQRMLLYEEEREVRFEGAIIHDAEDLIHPGSLWTINRLLEDHDMVQVPVLPLPTPPFEWTHGVYCDEFAECQIKDIPVRQFLGGFIASNGVGTGFSRAVLERLADRHSNRIFEPASLTEDYEAGIRIHALGRPQIFVPVAFQDRVPMATREYFPRSFRAAVRQRTRWVMGISLQGWERHGWRAGPGQWYWLWRDRKGLAGNLVTPVLNGIFLYGVGTWLWSAAAGTPWDAAILQVPGFGLACRFSLAVSLLQLGMRMACGWSLYGAAFALAAPLRAFWGNAINCVSTVCALARFFRAKAGGLPLAWLKTEHMYPSRAALMPHKRRLGEVLVSLRYLPAEELNLRLGLQPPGERLGEYLLRTRRITEAQLYHALSVQQSLPLGRPEVVSRSVARSVPAAVSRKWRVLPFRVLAGKLFLAGPELPTDEMADELRRYSNLELRYQLVTPGQYRELAAKYLE